MSDLSSLRRKRGGIQKIITNFNKIIAEWNNKPESRDPDYVVASLEGMQRAFERFHTIQDAIEDLDETEVDKRVEIEDKFNRAVADARRLLRERGNAVSVASSEGLSSRASTPNIAGATALPTVLPQIALPKFDGSPEGWASFYDIFSSLIDRNENLHPVRKLQYLRLSLTGRAASAIESLETTEQNYNIALTTLKKKFECERRTLRRHWVILRDYPRLPKDTSAALNQLIDTFSQHTRALENLKAPVDKWDIPLIDLILSKVSQNTAWQWELTLTDHKMPSYKSLLDYLEKRASCSDFTSPSQAEASNGSKPNAQRHDDDKNRHKKPTHQQRGQRAQTFATTTSVSCNFCNEGHRIYACGRFRALSIEDKQKAITSKSLCTNCLGKGHASESCKSGPCYLCQERHHTLLHKAAGSKRPVTDSVASTSQLSQDTPSGRL